MTPTRQGEIAAAALRLVGEFICLSHPYTAPTEAERLKNRESSAFYAERVAWKFFKPVVDPLKAPERDGWRHDDWMAYWRPIVAASSLTAFAPGWRESKGCLMEHEWTDVKQRLYVATDKMFRLRIVSPLGS